MLFTDNCTSVTDFDNCPGNKTDFIPENSVCASKMESLFASRWLNML